jgi:hypothetical protein
LEAPAVPGTIKAILKTTSIAPKHTLKIQMESMIMALPKQQPIMVYTPSANNKIIIHHQVHQSPTDLKYKPKQTI